MKKYKLTEKSKIVNGVTVYRIKALKDIPIHGVKAGDLGGFVQSEQNLSQSGSSWIFYDAYVYDDAQVSVNAIITKRSDYMVFKNSWSMGTFTWTRSNNMWCFWGLYGTYTELFTLISCIEEVCYEYDRAARQVYSGDSTSILNPCNRE